MPNYPNHEVEREVRSRVNGAMEELIRRRNSELRELAASKFAPGPGMGSGPYEQMRVRASIDFYEALFQQIVDSWVDVLTRQSGRISASDVSHVVQDLEARASVAPTHIRQALASRGATAHLLAPSAMKALEGGARQRMNELVAKHRRELQTRLYNQDHPRPGELQPMPNRKIKINSDNTNSTVTSGQGNRIAPGASKKGWWETWWGVVVTSVIAGLILLGFTGYLEKRSASGEKEKGKAAAMLPSAAALGNTGLGESTKTSDSIAVQVRRGKAPVEFSFATTGEKRQQITVAVLPRVIEVEPGPTVFQDSDLPKELPLPNGTIGVLRFDENSVLFDTRNVPKGTTIRGRILDYAEKPKAN
jgi:hypothetical protein